MNWFNFSFRDWVLSEGVNTLLTAQYKKQFPQATEQEISDKINLALAADPTPGKKYINWIFKEFLNNRIRLPEDTPVVLQQLAIFDKSKPALKRLGKEVDITKYDSYQLWRTLSELGGATSKRVEAIKIKQEGAEKIYEDDEWLIIKMTKPEACTYYARGTKWCTSNAKTAAGYLDEGSLFIIYRNSQVYAQVHVASGQLMDSENALIPPSKVPEKLRDIIKQHVPVEDEFRGKRNDLFGIKEKVITYPDGFYWGTSDHKSFLLIDPHGEEEVVVIISDGNIGVDRPREKDLEGIMDRRKGDWKEGLRLYKPAAVWNKYIVDFIIKNKEIKDINPVMHGWNFGDLSNEDREKLSAARKDLMPPIDLTTTDGQKWTHRGDKSFILLDQWYPTLSMQIDDNNNLIYGNWLSKSKSKILKDDELDKSKHSLATTEFLLNHNVEHFPSEGSSKHYNSWKFQDLLPQHQEMILRKYPHFNDDLIYHQKQSVDQKDLLKRLGSSTGLYDIQPLDEKTVILRPFDTLKASSVGNKRDMPDLFGDYEEKDKLKKMLYHKINGYGDWELEKDLKDGNIDKIKKNLPFLDTNLLKNDNHYKTANIVINSIGKHIMSEFMKILYHDLKNFENDKFKVILKDDNINFVTSFENVINTFKQHKTLKPLEEEYKNWKNNIKLPFKTIEHQVAGITKNIDKEEFDKHMSADIGNYYRNKYEFD